MKPEDAHSLMDELAEEQRLEDAAVKAAERAEDQRQMFEKQKRMVEEQRQKAEHEQRRKVEEQRLGAEQQSFNVFEQKLMAREQLRKKVHPPSTERLRLRQDGRLNSRSPQIQRERGLSIESIRIQPLETPEIRPSPVQQQAGPTEISKKTLHVVSRKAKNLQGLELVQMMHENSQKTGCFPKFQKKKPRTKTTPIMQKEPISPPATLRERKEGFERTEAACQGPSYQQLVEQPMSTSSLTQQEGRSGPKSRPGFLREPHMQRFKIRPSLARQEERARPEAAPGTSRTQQQGTCEIATGISRIRQEDNVGRRARARTPRTGRGISHGQVVDPLRGHGARSRAEQDMIPSWRRQQEQFAADTRAGFLEGRQETEYTRDPASRAAWSQRQRVQEGGMRPATKSLSLDPERPEAQPRELSAPSQLLEKNKAETSMRAARKQPGISTAEMAIGLPPRRHRIVPRMGARTGSLRGWKEQLEAEAKAKVQAVIKALRIDQEQQAKVEQRNFANFGETLQEREDVYVTAPQPVREEILPESGGVLVPNPRAVKAMRRNLKAHYLQLERDRQAAAKSTPETALSRPAAVISRKEAKIVEGTDVRLPKARAKKAQGDRESGERWRI